MFEDTRGRRQSYLVRGVANNADVSQQILVLMSNSLQTQNLFLLPHKTPRSACGTIRHLVVWKRTPDIQIERIVFQHVLSQQKGNTSSVAAKTPRYISGISRRDKSFKFWKVTEVTVPKWLIFRRSYERTVIDAVLAVDVGSECSAYLLLTFRPDASNEEHHRICVHGKGSYNPTVVWWLVGTWCSCIVSLAT